MWRVLQGAGLSSVDMVISLILSKEKGEIVAKWCRAKKKNTENELTKKSKSTHICERRFYHCIEVDDVRYQCVMVQGLSTLNVMHRPDQIYYR